jgi:SHS2 domain-containing protein
MYELFDHTADLGLRARAPNLDSLFAETAQALFAAIVDDPSTIQPQQKVSIALPPDEPVYLLLDWLKELLHCFDADHFLFRQFTVHVNGGVQATAWGELYDSARHHLAHEVKAITYHGLRVEQTPDGWLAEVIVDI